MLLINEIMLFINDSFLSIWNKFSILSLAKKYTMNIRHGAPCPNHQWNFFLRHLCHRKMVFQSQDHKIVPRHSLPLPESDEHFFILSHHDNAHISYPLFYEYQTIQPLLLQKQLYLKSDYLLT